MKPDAGAATGDPDGGGTLPAPSYDGPGLKVWWHTADFTADPRFADAYRFGMDGARDFLLRVGAGPEIRHEWPVFVCCWAAWHAAHLPGDFVECGTNTGLMSMAVCRYVDFNGLDKDFYLFDTYRGIPAEQISEAERRAGRETLSRAAYRECYEETKKNFSGYPRVKLVRGTVPATLPTVEIERVCYLSIDMNVALPEVAALEHFWEKLSPGAPVVLDDYGKARFVEQKRGADEFARRRGVKVLDLPTGQGLLLKP